MFKKKFVMFEIEKKDTMIITDEFAKYTHDLRMLDRGTLEDREIYLVCFHCRLKDYDEVLNKLVKLLTDGVSIRELSL